MSKKTQYILLALVVIFVGPFLIKFLTLAWGIMFYIFIFGIILLAIFGIYKLIRGR